MLIRVEFQTTGYTTSYAPPSELEPWKAFEKLVTQQLGGFFRLWQIKVHDDDIIVVMGYSALGWHYKATYRGPREEMERLLVAIRFYIDCEDAFDERNNMEATAEIRRLTADVTVPQLNLGSAFRAKKALIMFLGKPVGPHLQKLRRLNEFELLKVVDRVVNKGRPLDAVMAKL